MSEISYDAACQMFNTEVTQQYQNLSKLKDTIEERHGYAVLILNVPVSDLLEMNKSSFAPTDIAMLTILSYLHCFHMILLLVSLGPMTTILLSSSLIHFITLGYINTFLLCNNLPTVVYSAANYVSISHSIVLLRRLLKTRRHFLVFFHLFLSQGGSL